MIEERSSSILEAAIREFIDSGEPVSSSSLYDHYNFGIKPAMIRLELCNLTEHGFLEQPYHSAGRVPTDRGYEFFASKTLENSPETVSSKRLGELFEDRAWENFVDRMSRDLGILSVVAQTDKPVFKDGLENLIDNLEWHKRSEILDVIRDFEEIDRRLVEARNVLHENFLNIFIGKKSPVTRSPYLSVVAGEYEIDGRPMMLFAIGPKRMDYERTTQTFKGLKKVNQKKHGRRTK